MKVYVECPIPFTYGKETRAMTRSQRHDVEFQSTVKDGLPIIVRATINPAEPDVGIMFAYPDDLDVYWPNGMPISASMYDTIPQKDIDRLHEEAVDQASGFDDA